MNPFERLRQAIDKVNITYQFEEDHEQQAERDQAQPQSKPQPQVINDPNEINRIKQIYNSNQTSHITEINSLSSKIEQITKSLKRAEATIQSQINDIVSLEKENQLLKENLNQQYRNIVGFEEKERKLKEEIYRVNIIVNELSIEINSERTHKKQLMKELDNAKMDHGVRDSEVKSVVAQLQEEKEKLKIELEERKAMFEYNVKKNADDRNQYKSQLVKLQDNYEKTLNGYRLQIDKLKQELFQSKKEAEILSLRKKNLQEQSERTAAKLQQAREGNIRLQQEVVVLRGRCEELGREKDQLVQSNSSLGSNLQEQRKNVKVKVVEVRDETALLELEMYKRQCKELMQERAILNSVNRSMESNFRVVSSELVNK